MDLTTKYMPFDMKLDYCCKSGETRMYNQPEQ